MSKLKVSAIHDPDNDNQAISIDSSGNITAPQNATISGTATVTGTTTLSGNASIGGNATITGTATVTGNASFNGNITANAGTITANSFSGDGSNITGLTRTVKSAPSLASGSTLTEGATTTLTISNYSSNTTYTTSSSTGMTVSVSGDTISMSSMTSTSPQLVISASETGWSNSGSDNTTRDFTINLSTPSINSPDDNANSTDITYTISNISSNADKVVFDAQSSNFTLTSVSSGTGTKSGNTVEVTGFTGTSINVVVQYTTDATYTNRAKVVDTTGDYNDSAYATDSITIEPQIPVAGATDFFSDGTSIGHWKFENTANDSSGTNNGTAYNITYSSSVLVEGSYSASFNGTSSYIDVGDRLVTGTRDAFTFSFWARGSSGDPLMIGSMGDMGIRFLRLTFSSGTLYYSDGNDGSTTNNCSLPANANTAFNHYCLTKDTSGNYQFYINGTQQFSGSGITNTTYSNDKTWFGRHQYNGGYRAYFDGYLDNVRAFTRHCNSTAVSQLAAELD